MFTLNYHGIAAGNKTAGFILAPFPVARLAEGISTEQSSSLLMVILLALAVDWWLSIGLYRRIMTTS